MDGDLSKADIITRMYILATIQSDISEHQCAAEKVKVHDLASLMADMRIRLEMTFVLMPEQKANICSRAMDLIIAPTCTNFKLYHIELEAALLLTNVFSNPAREKILAMHVWHVCSNVQNTLREDGYLANSTCVGAQLWNGVVGHSAVTLTRFVYDILHKFKRGEVDVQQEHGYTIHLTLLMYQRRFAIEHPELLNVVEVEEEDITYAETNENTPPRKHQRTVTGRKPRVAGVCQVDLWFKTEVTARGVNLMGGGWKDYVKDTIDHDTAHFAPAALGNQTHSMVAARSSVSAATDTYMQCFSKCTQIKWGGG
ncbi:hypothetical protein POSPLADRAFT_1035075 [Postia placenta MAD-698-R-SB12]|uniref:Uncharacterized protein n=1 Tax=Postia placenta MAD-698-R-SB12 TaxID=670580 RepID=A0A1X6MWB9_9APHY|nr:hypothetical protein POSPLADRAFT_1035075 [Postia placenta MAD-698-R-SB12]OSX60532.1 hypothetical protein POSPLADRAFT_1035075 [Postia placenta MAD-698-R-SB12]